MEIINCEINAGEYYNWSKMPNQKSKFKLIKLHHVSNGAPKTSAASTPSSKVSFFGTFKSANQQHSSFSLSNNLNRFVSTPSQVSQEEVLAKKLNETDECLKALDDHLKSYKSNVKASFDALRSKIDTSYALLFQQLDESRKRLFNELEEFSKKCKRNIDTDSLLWNEFNQFLIKHHIDPRTIDFYLDHNSQPNQTIEELEAARDQLDKMRSQFDSFILMNKRVYFEPVYSNSVNQKCIQPGVLQCVESVSSQDNESFQFERFSDFLLDKPTAPVISHFQFEKDLLDMNCGNQVTVHSFDDTQRILVCERYEKSAVLYCDFYLFDLFGALLKKYSTQSKRVRVLTNNSSFLLFTSEEPLDTSSFQMNLFNSDLQVVKSISIEPSDDHAGKFYPIACHLDASKCYLLTNSKPLLIVFDLSLNLLIKLGQNLSPVGSYYMPLSTESIYVDKHLLYLKEALSPASVKLSILDLNSGSCMKTIVLPFSFTHFYVVSVQLLVFVNEGTLFCFDLDKQVLKQKTVLQNNTLTLGPNDWCLTKNGFIMSLHKHLGIVSVY